MHKLFTLAAAAAIIPLLNKEQVRFTPAKETPAAFHYPIPAVKNPFLMEAGPAQVPSENWLSIAQEDIRRSEYHFTWEQKLNSYCTPNRKNNLRFFYTEKGFSVEPRTTKIPVADPDPLKGPGEIKYRHIPNWKVRFDIDKEQVGRGRWAVTENKAEYITGNITVQYINNDEGMRQNFIVHKPLSGKKQLKINFGVRTKLRTVLLNNQLQFLHKKRTVLHYKDLRVWDATGKPLTASFKKLKRNKYAITVNTEGAVYPVTIDPVSTTPAASVQSNNAEARMGYAVSSAGDVNGDGYSDVIVGAYFYNSGQGAFYVYHGSASGISTTPAIMVLSPQPGWQMAISVSTAGDVNGDGYSDVIVGVPFYANGETGEGAFFVYHGSPAGIGSTPNTIVESNLTGTCRLGFSVACAGDINGDGYSDVLAGANGYSNGEVNEGGMYVYLGSASGINTASGIIIENNLAGSQFAWSVASAGDVNGDGYSDVVAGAARYTNGQTLEGAFYIFHGSASGLNPVAATTVESNIAGADMGVSVSSAGDLNGDGYSDVIVGAPGYNNGQTGEGGAYIYYGSASGVTPSTIIESNTANAYLGTSVACIGDVNGDGYSDISVGVTGYSNGQTNEGAAFIYFGAQPGISATPTTIIESNMAAAIMGAVASAGDVNGDGYSDLVVGASQYTDGELREGAAFVYHGTAAGLSVTPNKIYGDGNESASQFGISVAPAGDINGDGYSDLIVGARNYDDGANIDEGWAFIYTGSPSGLPAIPAFMLRDADQAGALFGHSVASAGDVNADGYGDVIVGAYQYTDGANAAEGRAFVYYGSLGGMSTTANRILNDADQGSAFFGYSVASAGDVNGDGYSDVIVGAYGYDDGANANEGRAFVYHGSATGLSATPVNTPDDADQAQAFFGVSVASAGDVNGDGYSDVIIGAYRYDDGANTDEGVAFVYHGSAAGLAATPGSMPDDAGQFNAGFGISVASAGDVNGDGYSDVIIGAYRYDNGASTDEGAAFVYHGSATGVSAAPDNILAGAGQAGAFFGYSVACAGDVNGDGYNDVIIGAYYFNDGANTNEGRAYIYRGSATGLSSTPDDIPDDANEASAFFGVSVASAGDVNGDGYSDVVIGAYLADDGNADEGKAYIYNGNELTTNKRNNLRLYNSDLIFPVSNANFVFANFGAGLFAKSFLGRNKGKMVWETRVHYLPYSGNPITNSTAYTSQQAAYSNLGLAGTELKSVINKWGGAGTMTKLRARVKYHPATAITGQLYGPWRYVSAIIDGNKMGVLPVELISFKAAWLQRGKTAQVSFTTDKENGICCFDIEKSTDGFNYDRIATIPAKNTPGVQAYTFTDNNAAARNQYYRLKITGMQGQTEYSSIQLLQYNGTKDIFVFPNPTAEVLQLSLNAAREKVTVQIINSAGQLVKAMNNVPVAGNILKIPVSNLSAGNYWVKLQAGEEQQVLQFVKK